jgi:hypothetical protein
MKKILTLPNILILILISIITIQNVGFGKKPDIIYVDGKPYEVIKWKIDTQEVVKRITITKPGEIIYRDTTIYVEVPKDVDTTQILKNYFAKNVYKDTLIFPDTLGYVSVIDTISKNTIFKRTFDAHVRERIITDTKIVKDPPKIQVFLGGDVQFSKSNFVNSIGTGMMLKDKRDRIYHLGVGVTENNLAPYLRLGYYKKLKIK